VRETPNKNSEQLHPSAAVHRPVLEGRTCAIYVAHQSRAEWLVGGLGFAEAEADRFERVALMVLRTIDPSVNPALSLPVGWCAFREHARAPWTRGRIPQGRTFLLTYELRPTQAVSQGGSVGGAFANCWVIAKRVGDAVRRSRRHLEDTGWVIVADGPRSSKTADDLAEGTESYFRQAQIDGFVCVLHTFPPEMADS